MNILHVTGSVDPRTGGVAESIRTRGIKLLEMGHRVEVASLDAPGSDFAAGYPLPLHLLGPGLTAWQYSRKLRPWIRANAQRFDAVVVDGLWQHHGLATRAALQGTGVPYFVFPHGMLDPWFKRTYPLKHLKKWLVWPWAEYRVLRDARAVLYTCEEERRLARQSFWLYQAHERLAPLGTAEPPPNGAGLTEGFLTQFPALRDKPFLLFLGRLHPKKGCDLLIEAFAQAACQQADYQLVMAGPADDVYLAALKAQADSLGIGSRVHWLGMVKGDTKWGALYASEAFALFSHQENFGLAVVEALACGKPVLISDRVNIWREIAESKAGLIGPDTPIGAANVLSSWLGLTDEARSQMRERSLAAYAQRFTVMVSARSLLDLLANLPADPVLSTGN